MKPFIKLISQIKVTAFICIIAYILINIAA